MSIYICPGVHKRHSSQDCHIILEGVKPARDQQNLPWSLQTAIIPRLSRNINPGRCVLCPGGQETPFSSWSLLAAEGAETKKKKRPQAPRLTVHQPLSKSPLGASASKEPGLSATAGQQSATFPLDFPWGSAPDLGATLSATSSQLLRDHAVTEAAMDAGMLSVSLQR